MRNNVSVKLFLVMMHGKLQCCELAMNHIYLFNFILAKLNNSTIHFLYCICHIPSVQLSHVASGYHIKN